MEPVLNRVLPAAKVSALKTQYTASKTAFFNGIVDQRAFEFAGEALRKGDLIRWGNIDTKMAEAKAKLQDLQKRQGNYAGYPDKVYINNSEDKDNIEIYGLNKGEDDSDKIKELKDAGWDSKNWFESTSGYVLTDDYINGLYVVTPSTHCLCNFHLANIH